MRLKKKKDKKKIKNLFFKIFIAILVIGLISAFVYYFLTAEDEESSLTLIEKQWIENNRQTLVNIEIPNNIDIVSEAGSGMIFDFLSYFEENTELKFNKVPYNYPGTVTEDRLAFVILDNSSTIQEDDILIFEDSYVVLGLENKTFNSENDLNNKNVGVIESQNTIIDDYFLDINVTLKNYSDITNLINGLKAGEIHYAIVPRYAYLSDYASVSNIYVNYDLNNLSNKIVLRLGSSDRLNTIITKSIENWMARESQTSYEKNLLNFYSQYYGISELEKAELTKRVYTYGFVEGTSYNIVNNGDLYGVAGSYINTLKSMLNMDFEYVKYATKEDMLKDLDKGKLDIAFINFPYEKESYLLSSSPFIEKLAVVSTNYLTIDKRQGLSNYRLYAKEDDYLYEYLKENYSNLYAIDSYKKVNGLIVIDENDYLYLKDSDLQEYHLLFTDNFIGEYKFVVKNDDVVLNQILNYILNNTSYSTYKTNSINDLVELSNSKGNFKEIYLIILAIVLLPIIVSFLCVVILKNSKKINLNRKENFLKYNDMLTNLKNRNYLNASIQEWENTKIYPRTIIIIDLNNLKYVNDNYGHEEGNELIKKAAAILINTQLEKSDIIRTDGNEFLIYLIGYSKNQISTYISKLAKEFEKLPYGFGAALGYSMIEDEIKNVDDAINEATIEMRMDKEQNYR